MSKEKPKTVFICIHGNNNLDFLPYVNHLNFIVEASRHFNIGFATLKGVRVAQARNEIMKVVKPLADKIDYIFFLDTDHIIPEDTLTLLAQHMENGYSMASGLVHRRLGDLTSIGYVVKDDEFYKMLLPCDGQTYDVDTCAFGATLINLKDLLELEDPIFQDRTEEGKNGRLHNRRSDINVCRALRKLNKKICIDTRVKVGHISEPLIIFPQNADKLRELKIAGDLDRPTGYSGLSEKW
jgi:hypothetical protein